MGHRLTRIYTRTGDTGTTGLGDGSRIDKDAPRVAAYGELDELNSHLGLVLAHGLPDEVRDCLIEVQHRLFDLGGDLCIPGRASLEQSHVEGLERWLDYFNERLPPLKDFILPGGGPSAAHCQVARTVCRRAERTLTTLARAEPVAPVALAWVNRLSDLLFVLARILAQGGETLWQPGRPPILPPR
ncbi:cob(I)alamin adenosyltransferase [Methylomagnum ishizawai]|uniref:Corrinoid adenosyltransferase n=1 Tax=Methylomagnum ishizawai TaxID=1760988 RepID=A0A1Y6CW85_9GAMM|nr:cob(I)yrinic acid a,c-diamide adenosyltransferase [Methylomagnum ishizawai]SMF94510.1 cob(I)alamin adenosyltransferase [Methylomagnum ishizawai]